MIPVNIPLLDNEKSYFRLNKKKLRFFTKIIEQIAQKIKDLVGALSSS